MGELAIDIDERPLALADDGLDERLDQELLLRMLRLELV